MGLSISKKDGESFEIGDIVITVLKTARNYVRLNIEAPASVPIRRQRLPRHEPPCLRAGDATCNSGQAGR